EAGHACGDDDISRCVGPKSLHEQIAESTSVVDVIGSYVDRRLLSEERACVDADVHDFDSAAHQLCLMPGPRRRADENLDDSLGAGVRFGFRHLLLLLDVVLLWPGHIEREMKLTRSCSRTVRKDLDGRHTNVLDQRDP